MPYMSTLSFHKRTFKLRSFAQNLGEIFVHLGDLKDAVKSRRIDRAFGEKIMLAVTQVNDCRYCSYFHTRQALKAGVSEEQVRQLLAGELGEFPPGQVVALAFAQHYAEQGGRPDPQAWQKLVDCYGPAGARDILAYIRMITFGNLLGNTFDYFLFKTGLGRK